MLALLTVLALWTALAVVLSGAFWAALVRARHLERRHTPVSRPAAQEQYAPEHLVPVSA